MKEKLTQDGMTLVPAIEKMVLEYFNELGELIIEAKKMNKTLDPTVENPYIVRDTILDIAKGIPLYNSWYSEAIGRTIHSTDNPLHEALEKSVEIADALWDDIDLNIQYWIYFERIANEFDSLHPQHEKPSTTK